MEQLRPYDTNPDHNVLTDAELDAFFADLDRDNDDYVTFDELEAKLEDVHLELAPEPKSHHLHHPDRRFTHSRNNAHSDVEKGHRDPEHDGLHAFLRALLPDCKSSMSRAEFIDHVRSWNIPSQDQTSSEEEDAQNAAFEHRLSLRRRLRAHWSVEGPKILFICLVVGLQIALGVWQGVKYIYSYEIRTAIGWGVILAKFCAGALYPTIFFLLLSMSRLFATFMRRFYHLSRFINWDRSQSFHIWMACTGLVLATLHAIGHLTGTFLDGSRAENQANLAALLGSSAVPKSYADFARSLPGWTGIASLAMFWTISLLSMPAVRRWSYEVFQLGHLLMFPMMGLLSAHGVAQLLGQYPMLGFWIVFPGTLVIVERSLRIIRGFIKVPARMELLDDDTVSFTCKHPRGKDWRYHAGQYVFLQVPSISFFQWHPFTISACSGSMLQMHIKTDGNWTEQLRSLPEGQDVRVGIDGPYGAPAQRFYDFNKSIIIGSGVGITPFSAIITDLEQNLSRDLDPWAKSRRSSRRSSRVTTPRISTDATSDAADPPIDTQTPSKPTQATDQLPALTSRQIKIAETEPSTSSSTPPTRRVDFHWMVREKNHLLWFSALLNRAHDLASAAPAAPLDLRLHTHITARRKNISTHIFRYLLDAYRTPSAPHSALTGLKPRSSFGRPDLPALLHDFHADMLREGAREQKVGVFFCGSPRIGRVLADSCAELTARARSDGSRIRYLFMMEVFG